MNVFDVSAKGRRLKEDVHVRQRFTRNANDLSAADTMLRSDPSKAHEKTLSARAAGRVAPSKTITMSVRALAFVLCMISSAKCHSAC